MDPKYENVPGVEYETFEIPVPSKVEGQPPTKRLCKFAQGVPTWLPSILLELKQFRKQAKKEMAVSTGALKAM